MIEKDNNSRPSPDDHSEADIDTNQPLGLGNSEFEVYIRNMQADALLTAAAFIEAEKPGSTYTLRDLVDLLADAEREAQFICGFVPLAEEEDLLQAGLATEVMKERGLIDVSEDGSISLTEEGKTRANEVSLPPQIEEKLSV